MKSHQLQQQEQEPTISENWLNLQTECSGSLPQGVMAKGVSVDQMPPNQIKTSFIHGKHWSYKLMGPCAKMKEKNNTVTYYYYN